MKIPKALWITVSCLCLMIFACVTINIYFPAEEVKTCGKIVDDIRGKFRAKNQCGQGSEQLSLIVIS